MQLDGPREDGRPEPLACAIRLRRQVPHPPTRQAYQAALLAQMKARPPTFVLIASRGDQWPGPVQALLSPS